VAERISLLLSSALAVSLLAVRIAATHQWEYRFLVWNLFLAWVPYACAVAVDRLPRAPLARRDDRAAVRGLRKSRSGLGLT